MPFKLIVLIVLPLLCKAKTPDESPVVTIPPAPVVIAFIVDAIVFSYKTNQRLPLGTVIATPPLIVTGPTDDAL